MLNGLFAFVRINIVCSLQASIGIVCSSSFRKYSEVESPGSANKILRELENMVENGIHFEGLPLIDFANKKPNWEKISKDILSPNNMYCSAFTFRETKIKKYISYIRGKSLHVGLIKILEQKQNPISSKFDKASEGRDDGVAHLLQMQQSLKNRTDVGRQSNI